MPAFNLPRITDFSGIEPEFSDAPAVPAKTADQPAKKRPTRADMNALIERRLGPLKPLGQLMNVLASPDTKAGVVVGPINAISKLGNAVGDWAQGKPIDTGDAWVISPEATRKFNPFRLGIGQEVTPSDDPGFQVGGGIGAEILGAAVGLPVVKRLAGLAGLKRLANTRAVRAFAVAQKANPRLGLATRVSSNAGEALLSTVAATPFLDVSQGNLANVPDPFVYDPADRKGVPFIRAARPAKGVIDANGNWTGEMTPAETGFRLPGRVDENDNYLQAFGKTVAIEGLVAPLAVMGALSFLGPLRRGMFGEPVQWLDDLAEQELEPYTRAWRDFRRPQLPPAPGAMPLQANLDIDPVAVRDVTGTPLPGAGAPGQSALPLYTPTGGALIHGSAIERWLDEATQIRQVEEQRRRLMDAGLIREGGNDQLELNIAGGVDPEIEQQIRQLQQERGMLLELLSQEPDAAEEIGKQLTDLDNEISDLSTGSPVGTSEQLAAPRSGRQLEIDLDTRPEIDTFLANLDELSDAQLRDIHSRVLQQAGVERNAQELAITRQQVETLTQRLGEIDARLQAGEITPRGAKTMFTKAQRELQAAQQQLQAIGQRQAIPETTVGQQLEVAMAWQLGLDLSHQIELPFRQVARPAAAFDYRNADEYRAALQGWNRDDLRRLAMPSSSPEVAALVKARTGRRAWSSKKADIIDALVEIAARRNQYLPPEIDQLDLPLTTNMAGDLDAPLLNVPADLSTTSRMGEVVDADGNPAVVPMAEFQPRGLDPRAREQLKADILRRAIDNGEVQAPVTPIPNRPSGPEWFNQGAFIDELLADDTGQLALQFASDGLPPYVAGGKNADALIDEMRLRFEYNVLDAKAQQAITDAWMESQGWDRLSWDEKKRLGLMGRGMFALSGDELPGAVDQVRPPTAPFTPELGVAAERTAQPYRGQGSALEQNVPQFTPELKPKPERKPQTYTTPQPETIFVNVNGEMRAVPRPQAQPSAAAPAGPTTFTTERGGSVYTVNPDGGTTRVKGASGGIHQGDAGAKNPSIATVYVKPEAAKLLGRIYAQGDYKPSIKYENGKLLFTSYSFTRAAPTKADKAANLPGKATSATPVTTEIPFLTAPEKGLHPVELGENWQHVGSKIDKVMSPTAAGPKSKGKGKAPAVTEQQRQAREALKDISAQRAEIKKQIDDLRKKHQGGSC